METKKRTTKNFVIRVSCFLATATMLLVGACGGGGSSSNASATEVEAVALGKELVGLTSHEQSSFTEGLVSFSGVEDESDGLGPVFNSTGCAECHEAGAIGGAGDNLGEAVVTRIGGMRFGVYSDLEDVGGPVLQVRSLREFDPLYPVGREVVPPEAQFVSKRLTTPLFGLGLIEAIPDSLILARSGVDQGQGIRGHANMVLNPVSGKTEIGRFGWKSQISSLLVFAGDAYLNEMGITNDIFPSEVLQQGNSIPPTVNTGVQPNDEDHDTQFLASYMRFLAPPSGNKDSITKTLGGTLFTQIGCANCHTPSMTTGNNASPALSNKIVRLYSDLLVHRMGPALQDGIVQGQANGEEFRTAPLWGISRRKFLLHNGSAQTIEQAVRAHGGEADRIRQNYESLSSGDRSAITAFLMGL